MTTVLADELRANVRGDVRFDAVSRALYATDASIYQVEPLGVVIPASIQDAVLAVEFCARNRLAILPRGGGTSLAGQCCNVAVVMDMSKYLHRVIEIDVARRRARVESGCVLDTLRAEAGRHRLTFGPDPSIGIELQDAVHVFGEVEDDGDVAALAGQAGAGSARQHRCAITPADSDRRDDVIGISRNDEPDRNLPIVRTVSRVQRSTPPIEADFTANFPLQCAFELDGLRKGVDRLGVRTER